MIKGVSVYSRVSFLTLRNAALEEEIRAFKSGENFKAGDDLGNGLVAVPKEPTTEMRVAGMEPWSRTDDADDAVGTIWSAMVWAAKER